MRTELGKIKSIHFGIGGYQDVQLGLIFILEGQGWGVKDSKGFWDPNLIKCSEYTKWTEQDRDKHFAEIMRYISDLLHQAKVNDITKLQNIPIEATFDGNCLVSWRVLTEVL